MKNLPKVNEIRRKAKKFGTPLTDVFFHGSGIEFVYEVGDSTLNQYYSDADRGVREEITRLNNLLRAEEKLTTEF